MRAIGIRSKSPSTTFISSFSRSDLSTLAFKSPSRETVLYLDFIIITEKYIEQISDGTDQIEKYKVENVLYSVRVTHRCVSVVRIPQWRTRVRRFVEHRRIVRPVLSTRLSFCFLELGEDKNLNRDRS